MRPSPDPTPPGPPGLLDLEVRRGPLPEEDRRSALADYNRLTRSQVSVDDWRHCLEDGPRGPGLHALLRNGDGLLVGHICVFPLPVVLAGREIMAAKAEYFYLTEPYRTCRIRGREALPQPAALLLLKALYQQAHAEGIDPILISAIPGVDFLHQMAGAKVVPFQLHECLFILRPLRACMATPNLSPARRVVLFAVGVIQAALSLGLGLGQLMRADPLREIPSGGPLAEDYPDGPAAFSREPSFIRWRYPDRTYLRLAPGERPDRHLIARRGGRGDYLRICTTNLDGAWFPAGALLASLLRRARREGALGLRWSIYAGGAPPSAAVRGLRGHGCLCVARTRKILMHTANRELLKPESWQMEDSLVAFDG